MNENEEVIVDQKATRGAGTKNDKAVNYFSIHGTVPGGLVAAKSNLATEFLQRLILKSSNLRREIVFPDDFTGFRGKDSKTVVTNNTETFSLKFGDDSSLDQATEELFKRFSEKVSKKSTKDDKSYFELVTGYLSQMLKLEEPI